MSLNISEAERKQCLSQHKRNMIKLQGTVGDTGADVFSTLN